MKEIFILGLDCATPQLVFDKYLKELPTISGLIKNGNYGRLESTVPPVTVPAWMSMMTGKDPGQLGFYGFSDRLDYSYRDHYIVTNQSVKDKTIWDYLGEKGFKSIVMNLPLTYPPKSINGVLISSFLTPDKELSYTYPEEIKDEIDTIADGNYIIDVENFKTTDKNKLLLEIYDMTKKRFKVIKNYIKNKEWSLFIAVEMGIDRMHHGFWSYCTPDHELYDNKNEFKEALIDYYKFVDKEISEMIELFDDDTELMIVSDHGARTLKGTFCLNDWLLENGYLNLKKEYKTKSRFDIGDVDWQKTLAWGSGGYYGKIYLNIDGREPDGMILNENVETIKREIMQKLSLLVGPNGEKIENDVFDTKKIYHEVNGHPPDLILYMGHLDWRVTNTVGNESLFMFEKTVIDNANHDKNGVYIHSERPKSALELGERAIIDMETIEQYSIMDVTPTVLDKFGINLPGSLRGRIIKQEQPLNK
jgi:predicted AlkP superfamily phosphohydrolase/phosphomutase